MFSLIKQLNLANQCTCNDDDEVTDKDMTRATAALSSINHVSQNESFNRLCIWMALFAGMSGQVQQKDS